MTHAPRPPGSPIGSEVTLPARGAAPTQPAYAALPPDARRGVVVLHEIFGRMPEIDRVVERFAAAGYAAVEPDLFTGAPLPVCIARAVRAVQSGRGEGVERIFAARDWLCERAKLPATSVGVIGFCMGGGFALATGPGFAAVSTNYGEVPGEAVLRGIGPTIGCYGGRDRLFRRFDGVLRERLTKLGVEHETHLFPDAGHSFLTDGHHPIAAALTAPLMHVRYDPELAEQAWERIFAFFDQHVPFAPSAAPLATS